MTFVEVKFECINWWGNEVYRTKNGTPILRLPEDGWFSIADPSDIDGEPCSKLKAECIKICPLIKHFCGGIECYCIAKKVY